MTKKSVPRTCSLISTTYPTATQSTLRSCSLAIHCELPTHTSFQLIPLQSATKPHCRYMPSHHHPINIQPTSHLNSALSLQSDVGSNAAPPHLPHREVQLCRLPRPLDVHVDDADQAVVHRCHPLKLYLCPARSSRMLSESSVTDRRIAAVSASSTQNALCPHRILFLEGCHSFSFVANDPSFSFLLHCPLN